MIEMETAPSFIFNKHVDGFYKTREEHYYDYAHGIIKGWDFSGNPLDVYHTTSRTGSIDYFERNSFVGGTPSSYLNPRTGLQNRSINPISGKFHWTDIPIYIPGIGLFPFLLYL